MFGMYRDYENPYRLTESLRELESRTPGENDLDELARFHEDISDLRERVRFAWADDEYDRYEY